MNANMVSIELTRLKANIENPNRMTKKNFDKLVEHIKDSGNYEPIVVREHPREEGAYEIINGHHRAMALRQLGSAHADCVVWDVDDDQVRILLTTLNRLGGRDVLEKKAQIIRSLSERFDVKELARLLPDSAKQIGKLAMLGSGERIKLSLGESGDMPVSVVFLMSKEQKEIVTEAVKAAAKGIEADGANKKAIAIEKICRSYLESVCV